MDVGSSLFDPNFGLVQCKNDDELAARLKGLKEFYILSGSRTNVQVRFTRLEDKKE